ncbi:hypothetical protein [Spirulina subsalsa]|uniref:hypothetical protein n=1 Tax=Spirulina subsalsa TaxID=54311 RepID=UPI00030F52E8|nr:hypothetical protein [Spirulina subsalsa]
MNFDFERDHQRCLDKLIWATRQLNINTTERDLSKIAELIVQAMTGRWRSFHTPDHIFEVGGSDNPIEVLAALFHDLVYVQVDQSVHFNLTFYITPFVREFRENLYIRDREDLGNDSMFDMVMEVFGFTPSQQLSPFGGQNEFLSALVAVKVLEPFIPPALILQIIACIEATIPFRPHKDGVSPAQRLYERLVTVNESFQLGLSSEELVEAVRQAVRMANRDVGSFANPNPKIFLDGTWDLLPETNHNLRFTNSYTVNQYRVALQKMEGFMNFLKPDLVFQDYAGEPNEETYQSLLTRAGKNLETARLYLGSKLFTIALLEALSQRFGRNIPLSTIMGELNPEGLNIGKLEDFLPDITNNYPPKNSLEEDVFELLEKGRYSSSSYDLKNSPLTTLMVKIMGFERIQQLHDHAKEFFEGKLDGESFLAVCDPMVVEIITNSLIKLFDNRKAALMRAS